MKKKISILLIVLTVLFAFYWFIDNNTDQRFSIILTGNRKGNLLPYVAELSPLPPQDAGGFAFFAQVYNETIEKLSGNNIPHITIDLGDSISGSPEAYYTQGQVVIDLMNKIDYDGMLIGNRELDFGQSILKLLRQKSNFPFISSNIKRSSIVPDFITPYFIKQIGKIKVGVYGYSPPDTPQTTPAKNITGLTFEEPEEIASKMYNQLKLKCDVIICCSQTRMDIDQRYIEKITPYCDIFLGTDFIREKQMDDHSLQLNNTFLLPIYGSAKGSTFLKADFSYNTKSKSLKKIQSERIPILKKNIPRPDADCLKTINSNIRKIDALMAKIIGKSEIPMTREYYKESELGNLLADIMRDYGEADVSFINAGNIREGISKGDITMRDIQNLLPFNNEIVTMTLKGKDIIGLVKRVSELKYGILNVSNMTYTIDVTNKDKPVLTNLSIGGNSIDFEKDYKVATNSFLASGGDRYDHFLNGTHVEIHQQFKNVVIEYIRSNSPLNVKLDKRIQILGNIGK